MDPKRDPARIPRPGARRVPDSQLCSRRAAHWAGWSGLWDLRFLDQLSDCPATRLTAHRLSFENARHFGCPPWRGFYHHSLAGFSTRIVKAMAHRCHPNDSLSNVMGEHDDEISAPGHRRGGGGDQPPSPVKRTQSRFWPSRGAAKRLKTM